MKKIAISLIALVSLGAFIYSCGEKMKLPTETPPTGNLGDTLYLVINPPWDADHGYNFSSPGCLYFGHDTYLYVADTGNNRILQLDAAGTMRGEFAITNPISISQDELMRLLVVTGEKKIYRIDVGPGGDRTPHIAFDYNVPPSGVTDTSRYFFKLRGMIDPTDRFTSVTDFPGDDKTYFVAVSSDVINNGRILRFWGTADSREYADSVFDTKYSDAVADTFTNPVVITGNGITTTTRPNSIYAYELGGAAHLVVCQDSGSYPVHDMIYQRQVWDRHWVFNYTHNPTDTDLLSRGFFSHPKGATVDNQGNLYVVDSGVNRRAGVFKFSRIGELLEDIDDYGYGWQDNNSQNGPVFNWVELNPQYGGNGTEVDLTVNSSIWVELGITFSFFNTNYDSINIGANGWCSFENAGGQPARPSIPNPSAPNSVLAVLANELNPEADSAKLFYLSEAGGNTFVIQYENIPDSAGNAPKTFQLILNSSDSSITFQYKYSDDWGSSSVVGIENSIGTIGYTIPTNYISNGYVVRFYRTGDFKSASGITYDIFGDRRTVYVADTGNNRILRFKLSTDLEP